MINDRPIEDPTLQRALAEVRQVMRRHGFAGACMLVGPEEAAYTYKMDAPWSAFRFDPTTPLRFRIRANSAVDGKQVAYDRVIGATHTVCQLSDFGAQTMDWMEQLKSMLRQATGIDFEHKPFGGKPLPSLGALPKPE